MVDIAKNKIVIFILFISRKSIYMCLQNLFYY